MHRQSPASAAAGLTVLGAVFSAALAALLLGGTSLAASPVPSSVAPPATASVPSIAPTPSPTLTMGPLVTLPPIVAPAALTPTALADGYALGDPASRVTVEVWEDFQCPYCQRYTQLIEPGLISSWVATGDVRLVYRDLPFLGEESRWASVAARLAAQQDRFWPFHDYLFANLVGENVGSFTLDRLQAIASAVGLDRDAFDSGLRMDAARALYAQIEGEARADAARLGIRVTPTVVVNGVTVAQPDLASISAAIEAALSADR
jgi:protein-disulfide isomerase